MLVTLQTALPRPEKGGRPTLKEYMNKVRGAGPGEIGRWYRRSFGATSPARFWHYWNPLYGYYLSYFVFKPLSRLLPRAIALYLTFLVCGFVAHDLLVWAIAREPRFPIFAVLFSLFAAEVIVTEAVGFNLAGRPFALRVVANVGFLAAAIAGAGLVEMML